MQDMLISCSRYGDDDDDRNDDRCNDYGNHRDTSAPHAMKFSALQNHPARLNFLSCADTQVALLFNIVICDARR